MTDETTGESGAANTPPFPRPSEQDPLPPRDRGPAGPPHEGAAEASNADGETRRGSGRSKAEDEPAAGSDRARRPVSRAGEAILRRAERTVYHGLSQLADQFEDAAERIDHLAGGRLHALGPRGERAAGAAESAAGWLHGSADYLRSGDLRIFQKDLEQQVREKPLQTLLISAGAGWLLGKIVR